MMILLWLFLPVLGFVFWGMVAHYSYQWFENKASKGVAFGFLCLDWGTTIGSHAASVYFLRPALAGFGLLWSVVVVLFFVFAVFECFTRCGCVAFEDGVEKKKAFILYSSNDVERSSPFQRFWAFLLVLSTYTYYFLPVIGLVTGLILVTRAKN